MSSTQEGNGVDCDKNLLSDKGKVRAGEKGINELGQITHCSDYTLWANAMAEMDREREQQSPKCTFIHYCIQQHKWGTLEKRHNNNVKVGGNGQNIGLHREDFLKTKSFTTTKALIMYSSVSEILFRGSIHEPGAFARPVLPQLQKYQAWGKKIL